MDKITVHRFDSKSDWTLSNFYFDKDLRGVGIEDEYRAVKVKGETRIPEDIYELSLRHSPKFSEVFYRDDEGNIIEAKLRTTQDLVIKYHTPHELIWVLNVPNFDFILWHWGNTDDNTDGCYLVGCYHGLINNQAAALDSKKKYKEIYPEIWREIKRREQFEEPKLKVEYTTKLSL